MKTAVRPLTDTDLQGIDRLRTLVWPQNPEAFDTVWQASVWRWLGMHPLAGETRRWVVADGDEVVGHLAAVAQYYRINGQRIIAHTPAEYGVLPQYGRYAVLLMRKFFQNAENCVSSNTAPPVISIQEGLGAEKAGELQSAVKLWDVAGILDLQISIPAPIPRLLNWGLQAFERVLSGPISANDSRVEVLDGFDESFDELFESVAAAVPCVPEKDASFLRWRYGPDSPQASATLLGVRGEDQLLGYAILWSKADGDGYLLDLTTRPGRHDVARSLLRQAVQHFRRAGVRSIKYQFLESPTSPQTKDLWRLGFFLRNRMRPLLLVSFADLSLHKVASYTTNWSYSFGDGEMTFWFR